MCQLKQGTAASTVENSDMIGEAKHSCSFKLNLYKLLTQSSFVIDLSENQK